MKTDVRVCPHCGKSTVVRLSSDISVAFRWFGNYYLIDVVLLIPEFSVVSPLFGVKYVFV